jgi:hypothetical protein
MTCRTLLKPDSCSNISLVISPINSDNSEITQVELEAVRLCAWARKPLRHARWLESIARWLDLESTLRPRGRQRVQPLPEKEA